MNGSGKAAGERRASRAAANPAGHASSVLLPPWSRGCSAGEPGIHPSEAGVMGDNGWLRPRPLRRTGFMQDLSGPEGPAGRLGVTRRSLHPGKESSSPLLSSSARWVDINPARFAPVWSEEGVFPAFRADSADTVS